ncbi:hypothetical protein [Amycolatopsis sp. cmx-11-51]|uniref:hypothetical protein n=1 Tax=Amycolatopsis sp. cmx-11-51 TaxID=2785797 RepID=UPI0039E37527
MNRDTEPELVWTPASVLGWVVGTALILIVGTLILGVILGMFFENPTLSYVFGFILSALYAGVLVARAIKLRR